MEYTCILRGRGYDVYRVTKGFKGLTYQEIADKLDYNNWGYDVRLVTPEYIDIKVYTD
jgi:hypothetical protein